MSRIALQYCLFGGVCGVWRVSGCCLRDPACCQGVVVFKKVGKVNLVLFCLAAASAFKYCPSGGCLWCVCGAWRVSGCCLRDPACCLGVVVLKKVGKVNLVLSCLAAASAFEYCPSGGCLWCVCGVWRVSGCCLRGPGCCQRGNGVKTSEKRFTSTILYSCGLVS